jgi:hypothetical protein
MKALGAVLTMLVLGAGLTGCKAPEGAPDPAATDAVTGGVIAHTMEAQERARLRAQAPATCARVEQGQAPGLADIKAMSRARIRDDVIISQIRTTRATYHLSAAETIDLQSSGVSQRVIEFMVNTPVLTGVAPPPPPLGAVIVAAPPPLPVETMVGAPGPAYVWIPGEWAWSGRWVWVGGHWTLPPYPGAVWVGGVWTKGPRGWRHRPGSWR